MRRRRGRLGTHCALAASGGWTIEAAAAGITMPSASSRSLTSPVRVAAGLLIAGLVLAVCDGSGSGPGSPAPSAGLSGSASGGGFYMRAWQTQALPQNTFSWLSLIHISEPTRLG